LRETRADIDLLALAANVEVAKRLAGRAAVMAVVKADAYGHGAVPVARTALGAGATWLGVALPEEGAALREAGVTAPILVLGPLAPAEAALPLAHDLDQCVSDVGQIEALRAAARAMGRTARVHLKVDTGMGRVGLQPAEIPRVAEALRAAEGVRVRGLMTHFAEAEAEDLAHTRMQLSRFDAAWRACRAAGLPIELRHAANSAGLLFVPEARLDLVRPGLLLYGYHPRGAGAGEPALRPALRLRTAIRQLKDLPRGASLSYGRTFIAPRDARIALLPIGYADGWSRLLSNRAHVLVRGRRAPVVGRVCMDLTLVDVTEVPGAAVGDEVVLIGRQGDDAITADEVAVLQGTISYEVLCRLGPRVPRTYFPAAPA
jgi:alanine racemase